MKKIFFLACGDNKKIGSRKKALLCYNSNMNRRLIEITIALEVTA
jgi:hypothetical protein